MAEQRRLLPGARARPAAGPARRAAALALLGAALALAALGAVVFQRAPAATELTYWDGAAADEPGYAEEAANQIEDGTYAAHVGYWERPGYWNNRAVADQGESEMDARMFADAASRKNWETAGTDFWDAKSLYSESEDDGVDQDMTGSAYDNSWPGTGANIYGWEDMAEDSDAYDGQWAMQPLDMEAADDAAVSQSDFSGFKAVSGARTQTLAECDACDSGADCVSGCRVGGPAASRRTVRTLRRVRRARGAGTLQSLAPLRSARSTKAAERAKLSKDDAEMADLERILHPKNRFIVNKLVDKVLGTGGKKGMRRAHTAHTGKRPSKLARRQIKRLSTLAGADEEDEEGDDGEQGLQGCDENESQKPGHGWFLGCNPGCGFSTCLRQAVRETSHELTPEIRPFQSTRQMNPGCKPGPGFSSCIVDNLDLDQPNYQKYGYWPILDDANSDFLKEDEGLNVDSWWDSKADAGATLGTFTPRRDSPSAEPDYAMKTAQTQSLRFVPGVGMVPKGTSVPATTARAPAAAPRTHAQALATAPSSAAAAAAAAKSSATGGEEEDAQVLKSADAALASADDRLSVEAAQKARVEAQARKRAQKQQQLRELEGKKVVQALNDNKALNKEQEQKLLVQELHRQLRDKNFKTSGYMPFTGNVQALRHKGVNVNGEQMLDGRDLNFKPKGYWPVNGNTHSLEQHGVKAYGEEIPGRNWHTNGYWPLNGGDSYLGAKGIKVTGTPLDEPDMPEQHIDTSSLGGWWNTVMGNGKKLSRLGIHVDTWEATKPHPKKLATLGVNP